MSGRGANWKETSLGAEVDLLTGFPFKSEKYTDSDESIRLVRGDNIVQGAMRWEGVKKWPLTEIQEYGAFQLCEGDVVLAMDRPWIEAGLKYAAISKYDLPCLLVQRTARLRGGPRLDTKFLRYLIGSSEFTEHIHAITTGTAVPHISAKQIKEFTFALPPLAEQKAIATVLGALDDKIELNRRMNATLEAMARALFQSWFVDFDPVRQNMDAKPCLAGRQAAENPIPEAASLPVGKIGGTWFTYAIECQGGSMYIGQTDDLRRRWKQHVDGKGSEWTKAHPPVALVYWEAHNSLEAAVAREAKLKSGSGREWLKREIAAGTFVRLPAGEAGAKLDRRKPFPLPLGEGQGEGLADLAALFPDSFQDSELGHIPKGWRAGTLGEVVEVFDSKRVPLSGREREQRKGIYPYHGAASVMDYVDDFLFDGIYMLMGEDGSVINDDGTPVTQYVWGKFWVNNHAHVLRGTNGICTEHLLLHLKDSNIAAFVTGAVQPKLNQGNMNRIPIIIPPVEIGDAFAKSIEPLFAQIRANNEQSRTLATLRDTLLPKLLSGELHAGPAFQQNTANNNPSSEL